MKERGIIFSTPMVRALLANAKTQTRRIVKPQHAERLGLHLVDIASRLAPEVAAPRPVIPEGVCPYGQPGDRLWVRETCVRFTGIPVNNFPWPIYATWRQSPDRDPYKALLPTADVDPTNLDNLNAAAACVTVPSIHMPRWASRLTLELTGVRVERLHEITEADARAEGCEPYDTGGLGLTGTARDAYQGLWDSLHGEGAWALNPWVWVLEFVRVQP